MRHGLCHKWHPIPNTTVVHYTGNRVPFGMQSKLNMKPPNDLQLTNWYRNESWYRTTERESVDLSTATRLKKMISLKLECWIIHLESLKLKSVIICSDFYCSILQWVKWGFLFILTETDSLLCLWQYCGVVGCWQYSPVFFLGHSSISGTG